MRKFFLFIGAMLLAVGAYADHTFSVDLSTTYSKWNVDYNTTEHTANFTAAWGLVAWHVPFTQSFTTVTLVVDPENTDMDVHIDVRYTPEGGEITQIDSKITKGSTTASVTIPETGTIESIRVTNKNAIGTVTIVSVTLSGLRDEYSLDLTNLDAGWTSSYNSTTNTITFGTGESIVSTWVARGWSVNSNVLNDYNTIIVEFEPTDFDVILDMQYTNTAAASGQHIRSIVGAGSTRVAVRMPADVASIENILLKNGSNTTEATTQTLTLTNVYLTTEKIDYFDLTKCTNTWATTKSSYDPSTYTITWTASTYHGWWIGSNSYNAYKSIVIKFNTAPAGLTAHLRYYHKNGATITDITRSIEAGSTELVLPIPENNYQISALMFESASACSLVLTDAYASMEESESDHLPEYKLTVTGARMATLVLPYDVLTLPTGVEAYQLVNYGIDEIWAYSVDAIEADKPVLIVADADDYVFLGNIGDSDDKKMGTYTNGSLVGTYYDINPLEETTDGKFNYVLQNGADGVAFYQVLDDDCYVPAYRAYLSCSYNAKETPSGPSYASKMRMVFAPKTPTDVENVQSDDVQCTKMLREGQIFIIRGGVEYNINGQRLK